MTRSVTSCCFSAGRVLLVEVTDACNQSCAHCFRAAGPGPRIHLDIERWTRDIAFAARDARPDRIVFSGGEPTLAHNLPSLVASVTAETAIRTSLCTNGWLLDPAGASQLVEAGLSSVTIGLEGGPGAHDANRGRAGSFSRAVDAMHLFAERGIDVTCNLVVTPGLLASLDELCAVLPTLPATSISVTRSIPHGRAITMDPSTSDTVRKVAAVVAGVVDIPIDLRLPECAAESCPSGERIFSLRGDGKLRGCPDDERSIAWVATQPVVISLRG